MDCKEPYRATKLWNEVIMAFQSGMPLKKHRRKVILYRDCFMASDGVTWLHCYLMNNPSFGRLVTRQQTTNLLGKFLKCRVIECITLKSKKCDFADNSHLYRFTPISPQQFKTLPLRLVQSPLLSRNRENFAKIKSEKHIKINKNSSKFQKENIPECLIVEKKMSLTELGLTWKTATLARLEQLVPTIDLNEILEEKAVSGHTIKHNVCRISKTGVVSLIDKTDDIPHWVISAMKCLANWPNASGSGSCLPNYPGFEKDVFKVVRDYFINPQLSLLPTYLSSAMLIVFNKLLEDQLKCFEDLTDSFTKENGLENFAIASPADIMTSTPLLDTEKDRFPSQYSVLPESNEGKLLLDDPEFMWDYPSMLYFETDFATSDPVTKMVSDRSTLHASYGCLGGSVESISTISVCSMQTNKADNADTCPFISPSPLKNWGSDSCLQDKKRTIKASQSLLLQRNISVERCNIQSQSMFDYLFIPESGCENQLNNSVCSSKTITEEDGTELFNSSGQQLNEATPSNPNYHNSTSSSNKSSLLNRHSPSSENNKKNPIKIFEEISFPCELKSSFQLLLLLLNPPNRRQLHLLFRVINKILKNRKFVLDVNMPMQDYLLETFLPAIVQSDVNKNILLGMVFFMLDHCEVLFQPPADLKEEVENLCRLRNGKIMYSLDDACNLTYCEMVSKQQYEEQKLSVSAEALKSLLHGIIMDENLSDKERRKRIKQFKESHPGVYYELFPGKQNHLAKSKSTFLNRFASLRM